jgi:hypothetical protein
VTGQHCADVGEVDRRTCRRVNSEENEISY